ncbi:MAG: hypothetical protein IPJ30_05330 [Acidobacteria bacterium]|nr:hypothetical protein [Acidobacteriota bacterium]
MPADPGQRRGLGLACALDGQPYVVLFSFGYAEGDDIYAFYSRAKDRVDAQEPKGPPEVEDIADKQNWTTIIVFGHYEELPDAAELMTNGHARENFRKSLRRGGNWRIFVGSERKELGRYSGVLQDRHRQDHGPPFVQREPDAITRRGSRARSKETCSGLW